MKSINPQTDAFYKFGDIREDKKRFRGYSSKKSIKTGYFFEEWITEESFQKRKIANNKSARKHAIEHPEKVRAANRKYAKNNRSKMCAKYTLYIADKIKRTPCWLTKQDFETIRQFYELAAKKTKETGISWHVDHVIPLRGKLVSGLHVPQNLQVILKTENLTKLNKFDPGANSMPKMGTYR